MTGDEFINDQMVIVRNCVGLPEGSDGFYTAKVLTGGIELTRLQKIGSNNFVSSSNDIYIENKSQQIFLI